MQGPEGLLRIGPHVWDSLSPLNFSRRRPLSSILAPRAVGVTAALAVSLSVARSASGGRSGSLSFSEPQAEPSSARAHSVSLRAVPHAAITYISQLSWLTRTNIFAASDCILSGFGGKGDVAGIK